MRRLFPLFALLLALAASAEINPEWTAPVPPFQLADNLYYVGSQDLAAYLVTTPAGNILINANLESSPPLIRASVEKLGFRWADTKILLNSQAHFDHLGGAAEVLRETHAKNMVMEGDADVVESGGRTDFLFAVDAVPAYPPAKVDRVLHDGDTVELGGVTLTAHKTAGHTRGCTTWTLQNHSEMEAFAKATGNGANKKKVRELAADIRKRLEATPATTVPFSEGAAVPRATPSATAVPSTSISPAGGASASPSRR